MNEYLQKTLDDELIKTPHTEAPYFKPRPRLEPACTLFGVWESRSANVYTTDNITIIIMMILFLERQFMRNMLKGA